MLNIFTSQYYSIKYISLFDHFFMIDFFLELYKTGLSL